MATCQKAAVEVMSALAVGKHYKVNNQQVARKQHLTDVKRSSLSHALAQCDDCNFKSKAKNDLKIINQVAVMATYQMEKWRPCQVWLQQISGRQPPKLKGNNQLAVENTDWPMKKLQQQCLGAVRWLQLPKQIIQNVTMKFWWWQHSQEQWWRAVGSHCNKVAKIYIDCLVVTPTEPASYSGSRISFCIMQKAVTFTTMTTQKNSALKYYLSMSRSTKKTHTSTM